MERGADTLAWAEVVKLPWRDAKDAAQTRLRAGDGAEAGDLLAVQPTDPRLSWLTNVLRRQVPLAAHAVAVLGERCRDDIRDRIARECSQWVQAMPGHLVGLALGELPAGPFRGALGIALLERLRAIPGANEEERRPVAEHLAHAMASLEPHEALPELHAALSDQDPLVRGFVAIVVGSLHAEVDELLRLHEGDPDEDVRFRARLGLGLSQSPRALPPLIAALNDEDDEGGAASALGVHRSTEAASALVRTMQTDSLATVELMLSDEDLPDLSSALTEELVAKLVAKLEKGSEINRVAAADLLQALRAHSAVGALVTALGAKSNMVRLSAMRALAALKARSAVPDLVRYLEHRDSSVVRTAATALGAIGAREAASALAGVLRRAKDEEARAAAAEALGKVGASDEVTSLIGALADRDEFVRAAAAEALASLGATEAIPGLVRGLRDHGAATRGAAARALGRLGVVSAAPQLVEMVASSGGAEEDREGLLSGLWELAERLTSPPDATRAAVTASPIIDSLLDTPWDVAVDQGRKHLRNLAIERQQAFVEELLHYERLGERAWTTGLLERQVPLAFRVAAECPDLPPRLQADLTTRMSEWVASQPHDASRTPLDSIRDSPGNLFVGLARELVRELSESRESPRRDRVIAAVSVLRPQSEEQELIRLATGKKRSLRRLAAGILAKFPTAAAHDALRAAATDQDHLVRLVAASALAGGGRPADQDVVRALLADKSKDVRLAVIRELGRVPGDDAMVLLRAALADRNKDLRAAAAAHLACRGDQDALRGLLEMLAADETDDADPIEARVAFEGIDDSSGILVCALEVAKAEGEGWLGDNAQWYLDALKETQASVAAEPVAADVTAESEAIETLVTKGEGRSWEAEGAIVRLWRAIETGALVALPPHC